MAFGLDTYSDIENIFNDWIMDRPGGNVSDLAKHYINRAQYRLWLRGPWDRLVKRSSALSLSSNLGSLPSDFGIELRVYTDTSGEGGPRTFEYFHRESDYYIYDDFDKDTGRSLKIQFFANVTLNSDPIVVYQRYLENFAASGTEYSFFPLDLVFPQAKLIRLADERRPDSNAEVQKVMSEFNDVFAPYEFANKNVNNAMDKSVNDNNMNQIDTLPYHLDEGMGEIKTPRARDNDYMNY